MSILSELQAANESRPTHPSNGLSPGRNIKIYGGILRGKELTVKEVATILGVPISCCSIAMNRLWHKGYVIPTGKYRKFPRGRKAPTYTWKDN